MYLRTLGNLHLEGSDSTRPKPLLLLAFLAFEGRQKRSELAQLFFPNSKDAADALSTTLRRLRGIVTEEPSWVSTSVSCDALEFLKLPDSKSVFESYSGMFLAGLDLELSSDLETWILEVRERVARVFRSACLDLGAKALVERRSIDVAKFAECAFRLPGAPALDADELKALNALFTHSGSHLLPELRVEAATLGLHFPRVSTMPTSAKGLSGFLVGREREWALLEEAWEKGKTILISGKAGVGKSRLALEFAQSKGRVLLIAGRPGDMEIPYSTHARNFGQVFEAQPDAIFPDWVRLEMSRIVPQMGLQPPPMQTDEDKLRFYEAKIEFYKVIAQTGWEAQVFDDVQFADLATAEAGIYIHSKLLPYQMGFPRTLFMFRAHELEPSVERRLHGWVAAGLAVWIDLEPLIETDVEKLVSSLDESGRFQRFTPEIMQLSGGIPQLILETLRSFDEHLNQNDLRKAIKLPRIAQVEQLFLSRFKHLSETAQFVARVAALAGEFFSFQLIQKTLGSDRNIEQLFAALDELERVFIMQNFRFTHDLMFEAVRDDISGSLRVVLHGLILDALESMIQFIEPDVLLAHALGTQRYDAAFRYAIAASERAKALLRPDEAETYKQQAFELLDSGLVRDAQLFVEN